MKISILFMTLIMMLIALPCGWAQDIPPVVIPTDPGEWFTMSRVEWLYGVIVIVGGYLSAFIPGLNSITSGVYRVLTWAILTGIGAIYFGADIWGVAITYFMATGLYEIVLKLVFKSPKVKDENGREVEGKIRPLIE